MDGLLIDSEPLWTVAEHELAARHGAVFTPEMKAAIIGTRLDVAVPALLACFGVDADPEATKTWLLARMVELFRSRLPLHDGALDLLAALRTYGVPLALVSSSYRPLVDAALEVVGADTFDAVVSGDEVRHGKPHPEPYLTAAHRL